jgi:hypothetical protein
VDSDREPKIIRRMPAPASRAGATESRP